MMPAETEKSFQFHKAVQDLEQAVERLPVGLPCLLTADLTSTSPAEVRLWAPASILPSVMSAVAGLHSAGLIM